MDNLSQIIGVSSITIAMILELGSYYKQVSKTLKTKKSSQVSSTAYVYKTAKYILTMIALGIYANWVGFWLEVVSLSACLVVLSVIVKYKPRNWRLF